MRVIPTDIADVKILEPKKHGDHRGFFSEIYSRRALRDLAGIDIEFVQDNHSLSAEKGVLRDSRRARLLATLMRMPNSHVLNEERASKRCTPRSTPSQASCATSSATARLLTYAIASRIIPA